MPSIAAPAVMPVICDLARQVAGVAAAEQHQLIGAGEPEDGAALDATGLGEGSGSGSGPGPGSVGAAAVAATGAEQRRGGERDAAEETAQGSGGRHGDLLSGGRERFLRRRKTTGGASPRSQLDLTRRSGENRMTQPWRLELGANLEPGGVRFRVWAPSAGRVDVVIEGPAGGEHLLARDDEGYHSGVRAGARRGRPVSLSAGRRGVLSRPRLPLPAGGRARPVGGGRYRGVRVDRPGWRGLDAGTW